MRVLAADLGLNVGFALLHPGQNRPEVGHFRIPHRALDLDDIGLFFVREFGPVIKAMKPDYMIRATRFISPKSTPLAIGPYYGLSMVIDMMAQTRGIKHGEVSESDARKSLVGKMPKGRAKETVRSAVARLGWPSDNEHVNDALIIGAHLLSIKCPEIAHTFTPLLAGA